MADANLLPDVTALLRKVSSGDEGARGELFSVVYVELRRLARRAMHGERREHTLQPTALVNEAFLRLGGNSGIDWVDRRHFFSVAGQTMRRILIDYARRLHAGKNWGGHRVDVDEALIFTEDKTEALLALDQALERLESMDSRQCRIVELRYFAGLTVEETAIVMEVSTKTVKRDWQLARAWLHSQIGQ